jgi:hypothetical protein
MTSKFRISEQSRRIILGGNPSANDSPLPQELMVFVEQALAYVVKKNLYQNMAQGENDIDGSLVFTFKDVSVAIDTDLDMYYSELPAPFISLPNERGVKLISSMKSQRTPFVRIPNGSLGLFSGLQSDSMDGHNTFFIDGSRVYFPKMDVTNANENVLIKLVCSLGGIDDFEELSIPPDIELEIVQMTVQTYTLERQNPHDNTNDNDKSNVARNQ